MQAMLDQTIEEENEKGQEVSIYFFLKSVKKKIVLNICAALICSHFITSQRFDQIFQESEIKFEILYFYLIDECRLWF